MRLNRVIYLIKKLNPTNIEQMKKLKRKGGRCMEGNNLIIYKNSDGNIIVDAIYRDETLWLSQKGMSKVFDVGVPAISKH